MSLFTLCNIYIRKGKHNNISFFKNIRSWYISQSLKDCFSECEGGYLSFLKFYSFFYRLSYHCSCEVPRYHYMMRDWVSCKLSVLCMLSERPVGNTKAGVLTANIQRHSANSEFHSKEDIGIADSEGKSLWIPRRRKK